MSGAMTDATVMAPGLRRRRLALLTRSGTLRGELAWCAAGLGLLAALMCAAHVIRGGFYYDDWSLVALGRFPGAGGLLHSLWLDYGQRPGQVLYYAALDGAFGAAPGARLALAAATVVLQATCFYALLRSLELRARDAAAVAALAVTFPFSDSLWLWGVLSLTSLAISAGLLGVVLALRALRGSGPRALALHAASLGLYVASVLSYEAFAVAGCLAGLLYARVVGLRRARVRWALDVVVIALSLAFARIVLPIDVATPSHTQSLGGMLHHAALIGGAGARLLGAAVLPLDGVSPWVGTGALVAVLVVAVLVWLSLGHGEDVRAELGRWLAVAAAGALAAVAAWAVYVPASEHYSPSAAGPVNRMNAAAGLGIAVFVYACVVLAARMLARLARLPARVSAFGVAAVTLALLGAYMARTAEDRRAWDRAAGEQRAELAAMHAALPRPPAGATVYAYGVPLAIAPGVPVLGTTLDLTSALRVSYRSPGLHGVPLAAPAGLTCAARGPTADGVVGSYGRSYLIDAGERRAVLLVGRAQCVAATARAATV